MESTLWRPLWENDPKEERAEEKKPKRNQKNSGFGAIYNNSLGRKVSNWAFLALAFARSETPHAASATTSCP
jgi:hypothetical protein